MSRFFFMAWAFLAAWFCEAIKVAPMFYTWFTLPGTVLHEGAHYLIALLLGGDPLSFNVLPQKLYVDGELAAIMQGTVLFHINVYDAAAASLAPLTLVPIPLFFIYMMGQTKSVTQKVLFLYGSVCGWAAVLPSNIDFNLALSEPASWPYALIVLPFVLILNSLVLFLIAKRYNR